MSARVRCTVVACLTGTAVLLGEVLYLQLILKLSDYIFASHGRAVLDHNHLKIGESLLTQAFQQFANLVRPVIDGDYDGVFHLYALTRPR